MQGKCCCNPKSKLYKLGNQIYIHFLHSAANCTNNFFTVPLFELYNSKRDTYFYTISLKEINDAINNRGYAKKGIIGLVALSQTDCKGGDSLTPIFRWYNAKTEDYLYAPVKDISHDLTGYVPGGIVFYADSSSKSCGGTWKLYRFSTATHHHFYTTDLKKGNENIDKTKGSNEGIVCHIWPYPDKGTPTPEPTPKPTPQPTPEPTGKSCSVNFGNFLFTFSFSNFLI